MYNITNANDVKSLEHYLLQQDMWYIITCCMNCLVVPCASNKTFFEEKMCNSIQENLDLQYYRTFKRCKYCVQFWNGCMSNQSAYHIYRLSLRELNHYPFQIMI